MVEIINMQQPLMWAKMNICRKNLELYRSKNKEGKYDEAIQITEALLRSFYDKALGRSEVALDEAA